MPVPLGTNVEQSSKPDAAMRDASASNGAAAQSEHLTIMTSRGGDGLGLSFKVEGSGRVFRLEPTRDPHQPRFWCFRVYRCTSTGVISQTERSWWGPGGMTRADLPAAVMAIRADPNKWLADAALAELRNWIMEPGEEPSSPGSEALRRAKASKPSAPGQAEQDA